ncbi:hypothetical protein GW17_00017399 [Ensete ventricosum]|nr:hypothetical protein GW17_00017399 [Ensete ventricosum]
MVPSKLIVSGQLKEKSIVDDRLKEKSTVGDRLREKKGRRRRRGGKEEEGKKKEVPRVVLARGSPVGDFSLAQGDETSPGARRKIEATRGVLTNSVFLLSILKAYNQEQRKLSKHSEGHIHENCSHLTNQPTGKKMLCLP